MLLFKFSCKVIKVLVSNAAVEEDVLFDSDLLFAAYTNIIFYVFII